MYKSGKYDSQINKSKYCESQFFYRPIRRDRLHHFENLQNLRLQIYLCQYLLKFMVPYLIRQPDPTFFKRYIAFKVFPFNGKPHEFINQSCLQGYGCV